MTDTVRTQSDLLTLFGDLPVIQNRITPQMARDLIVSFGIGRSAVVNVMDAPYNAKGNGVTDDSAALTAAHTAALAAGVTLLLPPTLLGYNIGTTGLVWSAQVDARGATLSYSGTGIALTYGNTTSAATLDRVTSFLPKVIQTNKATTGWAQAGGSDTGIRLVNITSSEIHVPHIKNFSIGLEARGIGTGIVYNNILLGHLENNKINIQTSADGTGWSNENKCYGGRCFLSSAEGTGIVGARHLLLTTATNVPNNNVFIGTSVEGDGPEFHVECYGADNLFLNCRWEATTPKAQFNGAAAIKNVIAYGFGSDLITVTQINSAIRNSRHSVGVQNLEISGGTGGAMIGKNTSSTAHPFLLLIPTGVDPYADASTTYCAWVGAQHLKGKRTGDSFDRADVDLNNGKVLVSNGTAAPTAGLSALGAANMTVTGPIWVTKSITVTDTPYTTVAADDVIFCDATGGAITVNLISAATAGRKLWIMKTETSANAVTLDASGAQTIDGALTLVLAGGARHKALIVSDGANWQVVATS